MLTLFFFFLSFFKGKPGKIRLPITPGHEFSGQVVKLGQGAGAHHRVKIGDVIVAEQIGINESYFNREHSSLGYSVGV